MFPMIHGILSGGGATVPPYDGLVLSTLAWQPSPGLEV